MNEIQTFVSPEFGQVRTVMYNGKPYLVGVDVARALGYSNPSKAVIQHCKGVTKLGIPSQGGVQETNCITEGDMYRLITHSELPSAERFESWVFDEVLPSIRQTGGYVSNDDLFIKTYLPFADESTKQMFKQTLFVIRQQNEQIEIMKPKAEYFDELVDRNLLTNFRDTAKELKIPQKDFINYLLDHKYIFRDQKEKLKPYAQYVGTLFEVKEFASKRNSHSGLQTLITPRGRETFRLLLQKEKV